MVIYRNSFVKLLSQDLDQHRAFQLQNNVQEALYPLYLMQPFYRLLLVLLGHLGAFPCWVYSRVSVTSPVGKALSDLTM